MIKKLNLEKNEETFAYLSEYVPGFNKDRALNGIGLFLKSEDRCRKYTAELRLCIGKAKIEHEKLKALQKTYNITFPSDNKNCLTTPHIVYTTVKSTLSEIRKSILRFCPRNSRRAHGTYTTTTYTLSTSYFCNQTPYTPTMFADEYPDYVNEVIKAMDEYMNVATENISMSYDLINEEKEIRENDELLKEIDERCRKDIRETAKALNKANAFRKEFITHEDLVRRTKEAKDMNEMRRKLYHNITWINYKIKTLKETIMEGMNHDLSAEEAAIWTNDNDYNFVLTKVRPAIEAMSKSDKLPSMKKRKSETERIIKAKYIACFMKWCRVRQKHYSDFIQYLTLKFANAPLHIPDYTSVCGAKEKVSVSEENKFKSDFEDFARH